ncbi:MAG: helix-turn-helix transcriptional regulator [Pyrinomonadaceae bacterium]
MMSTPETKKYSEGFAERFRLACGTSTPRVISEMLGLSPQGVANYLNGRLPDTKTLYLIREKTGCSIDWLLTGEGSRFLELRQMDEVELLASTISNLVDPNLVRELVDLIVGYQTRDRGEENVQENKTRKLVVKQSDILSEKVEVPVIHSEETTAKKKG